MAQGKDEASRCDAKTPQVETPPPDAAPEDERIPDFPKDCLPPILEKQAQAIADLCRLPRGMVAPMVLATASASLGRGLRVKSIGGHFTLGNLYILVCKTSGTGGSTSFDHAVAPLKGIQKQLRREFEEKEKPRLDAEHASISQQIESLNRSLKGAEGDDREDVLNELATRNKELADLEKKRVGKCLLADDITSEALASFLTKHNETLAHFDSDAADALGTIIGRYGGDKNHTNDTLWLKGYTGEPHIIFRKHSEPVHLEAPCLAVLFVATPDKVQSLFANNRLTSGGLLPRFLVCDPKARPRPIDPDTEGEHRTLPGEVSQPYEAAIFAAVNRYRLSTNDDPDEIDMMTAARRIFIEDWNRFCGATKEGADAPFEARHTENAIRIALVLHAFHHVEIKKEGSGTFHATMHGHEHPIEEQCARNAIQIRDWFTRHQTAFLTPQRVANDDAAWPKAEELMRSRSPEIGITARDLYTGRRVCEDSDNAKRLLSQWQKEGRVIAFERKPEGAGRRTTAYRLAKKKKDL